MFIYSAMFGDRETARNIAIRSIIGFGISDLDRRCFNFLPELLRSIGSFTRSINDGQRVDANNNTITPQPSTYTNDPHTTATQNMQSRNS